MRHLRVDKLGDDAPFAAATAILDGIQWRRLRL
jgi:hypothetical protein